MSCALTQNIPLDCRNSVGGILSVFAVEFTAVTGVTSSGGTVTAFGTSAPLRRYDFRRQTGSFKADPTLNEANGSFYWASEIDIQFTKLQANLFNEVILLGQQQLVFVVLDNNGVYWLVGQVNGLMMQTSTAGTGKAYGDLNGYTLKFTGGEPVAPLQIASSLVLPLVGA